eukprot:6481900-Amphidinium_carterae.1
MESLSCTEGEQVINSACTDPCSTSCRKEYASKRGSGYPSRSDCGPYNSSTSKSVFVCTKVHRRKSQVACGAHVGVTRSRSWVIDSGAGCDLVGSDNISADESKNIVMSVARFSTANGETGTQKRVNCEVERINAIVNPHVLERCPAVMSLGRRVMQDGFSFHWTSDMPEEPTLVTPCGE